MSAAETKRPETKKTESGQVIEYMWSEHLSGLEVKTKWPRGRNVTIERVEIGEVFDQQINSTKEMVIAYFQGLPRGLVVNKTNLRFLASKFGGDDKLWIGQDVSITAAKRSNGTIGVDLDEPISE